MPLVDTALAASVAARLAPPGPTLSVTEAADVVMTLRDLTEQAEAHVRQVTGLHGVVGPATVVDRPGWAAANAEGFAVVLAPLEQEIRSQQSPFTAGVTAKVSGAAMGSLLAWLSGKVLGQYEAFQPPGQQGRLLLNAPTIVATERRLGVDPLDFRLWVALHEVTHRTQFTAVPWLHDHVRTEITELLEASGLNDPEALLSRVKGLRELPRTSLVEALQSPQQKAAMDRVTAFMSLLEGHAEHVMDGVGPAVVPSVAVLRARFEAKRRERGSPLDRLLRRLLGLDMKTKQYAEGSRFVREVVDAVGMDGLNRVWESAVMLPSLAEVRAPSDWVARVHGKVA